MSSVYAVIQKNRTEIWEDDFSKRAHPITIYEPGSIPKGVHHGLDAVSSTYDVASIQRANKTYQLIPSWLKPKLEHGYERRIYQHLKKFDQVYLVGSGLGRFSSTVCRSYPTPATIEVHRFSTPRFIRNL